VDLAIERNTAMPREFLMRQMAWREALEEASDVDAVAALARAVGAERAQWLATVEQQLDSDQDPLAAGPTVRALLFVDRFLEDIDRRLDALDALDA
jgi:molecular chaperone HscB